MPHAYCPFLPEKSGKKPLQAFFASSKWDKPTIYGFGRGKCGREYTVCTEMLSKRPFLSLRDAENCEYSDFMAFKKFEVLFLLNNGGNLLNTPYSMAVFATYLATFLLANSGFCSIFYTFAPLIRIS